MPLLNPSLASLRRLALRILDRSLATLMGCFVSCFRVREEYPPRRSRPIPRQRDSETVLSRNPLSSVFGYEDIPNLHGYERMTNESETEEKNQEYRLGSPCTIDVELIDESFLQQAELLKACGTIQGTPEEIRKAVKRLVSPPLTPYKQPEVPSTPLELCRNSTEDVDALDHTPCSCISDVQGRGAWSVGSSEGTAQGSTCSTFKHPKAETDTATTPFLHRAPASDALSRVKSVRFETNTGTYSTRMAKNMLLEDEASSKPSPYPTPLKLSDEMQTPGTDFAADIENCFYGKGRVRCQYVYPDPIQNISQWKDLKKEGETRDFTERLEHTTQKNEIGVEARYSSCLKPPYKRQDGTDTSSLDFPGWRSELYRTPGDRPILGLVAVHWNEAECGQNPKCWDGNGIPNTTTKYKEDQRVTWHATPFEERLEKALSEERFVSQQG